MSRARSDCGTGSVRSKFATALPWRWHPSSFNLVHRDITTPANAELLLCTPLFAFLPIENIATDLPVQQDQFPVDNERCAKLRRLNPALQLPREIGRSCRSVNNSMRGRADSGATA
jgi:hypothetical protein